MCGNSGMSSDRFIFFVFLNSDNGNNKHTLTLTCLSLLLLHLLFLLTGYEPTNLAEKKRRKNKVYFEALLSDQQNRSKKKRRQSRESHGVTRESHTEKKPNYVDKNKEWECGTPHYTKESNNTTTKIGQGSARGGPKFKFRRTHREGGRHTRKKRGSCWRSSTRSRTSSTS